MINNLIKKSPKNKNKGSLQHRRFKIFKKRGLLKN